MTKEQYNKYTELQKEIEPLKNFLSWCGVIYHFDGCSDYQCRIVTRLKRFLMCRIGRGAIGDATVELPRDLQLRIIAVIEEYVAEIEKEMEEL